MQKYSRAITLIWLIISQLGGGVLVLVPLIGAGIFGMLTMGGGEIQLFAWSIAFICGVIFILLSLTLASWIAFFRKKDKVAAILSGICLLIGAGIYFAMQVLLPPAS